MTATVVLVHGAWHGGWCWQPVVDGLAAEDVPAVALDLPGHGDDPTPLTDLHGHGDAVRAAIDRIDGPVVLVGHSFGGAAVTDAGTHPAVRHVVFVSAFCLDTGETVMKNGLAGGAGHELEEAVTFAEDGSVTLDPAGARVAFYLDCDPAAADAAVARLGAESAAGFAQSPRAVAWRERPSTYVVCTEDRALTPTLQRNLATRCDEVVEWPTSHSPFLSRPDLVVGLLTRLASAVEA